MPIRPENKNRYPENWKEIRYEILERAKHCCEFCGVKNHADGVRDSSGVFHEWGSAIFSNLVETKKRITIVLTIAHLDHTPENNKSDNLKALCQKCHNAYDMPHRIKNRKLNKLKEVSNEQKNNKHDHD